MCSSAILKDIENSVFHFLLGGNQDKEPAESGLFCTTDNNVFHPALQTFGPLASVLEVAK